MPRRNWLTSQMLSQKVLRCPSSSNPSPSHKQSTGCNERGPLLVWWDAILRAGFKYRDGTNRPLLRSFLVQVETKRGRRSRKLREAEASGWLRKRGFWMQGAGRPDIHEIPVPIERLEPNDHRTSHVDVARIAITLFDSPSLNSPTPATLGISVRASYFARNTEAIEFQFPWNIHCPEFGLGPTFAAGGNFRGAALGASKRES